MSTFFDVEYLQAYISHRSTKIIEDLHLADKLEAELQVCAPLLRHAYSRILSWWCAW